MEPPEELAHLWMIYCELRNTTGGTGFGPRSIDFSELFAYQMVRGIQFEPWETDLILDLDQIYLRVHAKKEPESG